MDESVSNFFSKNAAENYAAQYELDHGPRLDAMLAHWGLVEELKGKRVLDIGGGLGFLGKRLDSSTEYWVIDGAETCEEKSLCKGTWCKTDLDKDTFSNGPFLLTKETGIKILMPTFDVAFCLETLEHLTNPYHCLVETKKLVKEGGSIYISIPHANVTHNYIYPALMVDPNNFAQFLGQMALPVRDYWLWDRGWNAHHFKCENRPYGEKIMLYPKYESKFLHATPIEMVNW
jgi:2-polyprenyl-3-methyl-5-hydroxy-6-metoxy-1,4-benzoquinol methylase